MNQPTAIWDDLNIIGNSEISHHLDCCVYVVDAGDLILIDAGAGASTERLVDNILALGLMPEKLAYIIATHAHIDHIGSLSDLKRKYNARVIAHELDATAIESGRKVGAEYYGVKYRPCEVDIKLRGAGGRLMLGRYEFDFIHIPGHTQGSMAVTVTLNKRKILFGQDIHGPYMPVWGGDRIKAVSSLKKLIEVKADILCEGHYGVIKPSDEVEDFIREFLNDLK